MQNAGAGEFKQPSGRWPANVVLIHHDECEVVGMKFIKGDNRQTGNGNRPGGFGDVGAESGDREPNAAVYPDSDAEAWDCYPDCPVRLLNEQTATLKRAGDLSGHEPSDSFSGPVYGDGRRRPAWQAYGDAGGASRFFYTAKASKAERNAGLDEFVEKQLLWSSGTQNPGSFQAQGPASHRNAHPTVKPIDLMRWLVRLVTPPDGLIFDPFTGSGTTGCAAVLEGFRFLGTEREAEYVPIARARIEWWASWPQGMATKDILKKAKKAQQKVAA
jgi:hypothetical protein